MQLNEAEIRKLKKRGLEEDAAQHLWAVSYSDMLMVLMCFFVIYFSMSESDKKTVLNEIIVSMESKLQAKKINKNGEIVQASTPGNGTTGGAKETGRGLAALAAKSIQNKKETDKISYQTLDRVSKILNPNGDAKSTKNGHRGIVVNFPDNAFRVGKFDLNDSIKNRLDQFLDLLEPHADAISITFIGHSDSVPYHTKRGRVVDSNMILSSLRAARAAEFAVKKKGWDPEYVSTQGFAEYARGTRSFSVRISQRRP